MKGDKSFKYYASQSVIWCVVAGVISVYATKKAINYLRQDNCNTTAAPTNKMSYPKIILFGDSITQYSFEYDGCWGTLLANKLQRKCDVLNRGFSGYNTRWNKIILPSIVTSEMVQEVAAVTIFLGANDSNNELNPQQTVPIDEYKQNMIDMVKYLLSIGIPGEKIILIGPPPFVEEKWIKDKGGHFPRSKSNKLAGEYSMKMVEAATSTGVKYVDLFTQMTKEENWERFLEDGLHFSRKGSEYFESLLWPLIENLTKNLPMILPLWSDVDNSNPHAKLST